LAVSAHFYQRVAQRAPVLSIEGRAAGHLPRVFGDLRKIVTVQLDQIAVPEGLVVLLLRKDLIDDLRSAIQVVEIRSLSSLLNVCGSQTVAVDDVMRVAG